MFTKSRTTLALALLAITGLACVSAQANTVSLRNGSTNPFTNQIYDGQSNNVLVSHPNSKNNNYGALDSVIGWAQGYAGTKGTIMQFNLSSLKGQVGSVTSATLTLIPTASTAGFASDVEFFVYLVAPENAGWNAGYGNGAAKTGESASAFKSKGNSDPNNVLWNSGGSFGQSAGDFNPVAIATGKIIAGSLDAVVLDIPVEVIEGWINNPLGNAGIWITTGEPGESPVFYSGNANATGTYKNILERRPELTIEYQIPESGTVALIFGAISLGAVAALRIRRRKAA